MALSPRRHHDTRQMDPHQDIPDPQHIDNEDHGSTETTVFVVIPREMLPCPMELRATVGPAVQLATKPQSSSANPTLILALTPLFVTIFLTIPFLT